MGFCCRQPAAAAGKGAQHQGKPPVKNGQHEGKQAQYNSKQPQRDGKQPQHDGKQPQHDGKQPQHNGKQQPKGASTAGNRCRRKRNTLAWFPRQAFFILRQPSLTNSCRSLRCPKKPALRLT